MRRGYRGNIIGKILIAAFAIVLAGVIMLVINSAYTDFAVVGYNLSASKYVGSGDVLTVNFNLENTGKIDVAPVSTVQVVNATIQKVTIASIADTQLPNYCSYNSTTATIANLTDSAGRGLYSWATVYVIPNEGVSSFTVSANVDIPRDVLHLSNKVERVLPFELIYTKMPNGMFDNGL